MVFFLVPLKQDSIINHLYIYIEIHIQQTMTVLVLGFGEILHSADVVMHVDE